MSTFHLLRERRFGPFFAVQFLGALNDNLFKNALVILLAFRAASEAESGALVNLAAGLFIFPFFIFSPLGGQVADRFDKSRVIRIIKTAEIVIMLVGAIGFACDSRVLLYATLFFMGTHSAFFGPVKYAILPERLGDNELVTGNALVEMGTFLAILMGTIAGGVLAGKRDAALISVGIVGVAALGWWAARYIPSAKPTAPNLTLRYNPLAEIGHLTALVRKKEALLNSIMGISWYWYFAATMLAQLPNYTKYALHGDESVVTLLLGVFAIAVGVGAMLCAKLSRGEIELGLSPLGAIGMSIFAFDLFFVDYGKQIGPLTDYRDFYFGAQALSHVHATLDLGLVAVSSSLFIVPLYALIQARSDPDSRSRVIAANNVYNALFMVASAIVTFALYKLHFNSLEILFFTAILNAVVAGYVFLLIPEFAMRFIIWILASTIYRLRYEGRERLPMEGAVVIVANHVSFIDWFIITAACRRPVRFVMDHHFFRMPGIGCLFKLAKAIPIAPAKEDSELKERAFAQISRELRDGNAVCIFPEGVITRDGGMAPFRPGIERILETDRVAVVPMALRGLWGSFFSRQGGRAMGRMPHPSRRVVEIVVGNPVTTIASAEQLELEVRTLLRSVRSA